MAFWGHGHFSGSGLDCQNFVAQFGGAPVGFLRRTSVVAAIGAIGSLLVTFPVASSATAASGDPQPVAVRTSDAAPLDDPAPPEAGRLSPLPNVPAEAAEASAANAVVVTKTNDPAWPVSVAGSGVGIRFGSSPEAIVELALPGGPVVLKANTQLAIGMPQIVGDSVLYEDVARDTDLRFDVGPEGVSQRVVLRTANAPRTFEIFVADPSGALGEMTSSTGGGASFGSGEGSFAVTPAYAYEYRGDTDGVAHDPGSATQTVTAAAGGYVVRSSVDSQWVQGRTFPVELDPDYAVAGTLRGGRFNPLTPVRVVDSRSYNGVSSPVPAGGERVFTIGNLPPSGMANAISVDINPIAPTATGYLTIYPTGSTRPGVSNVNFQSGQAVSNSAFVKLGSNNQVTVYNSTTASLHVAIDMTGWFSVPNGVDAAAAGGTLQLVTPTRIIDTRQTANPFTAAEKRNIPLLGQGGLPTNVDKIGSVVLNVTVVSPSVATYLTVWEASVATRPTSSALDASTTVGTLLSTKVHSTTGYISIFNAAGTTHVLVDVIGYFSTTDTDDAKGFAPYTAINHERIVDTRSGIGTPALSRDIASLETVDFTVLGQGGLPTTGVGAVALNVKTMNTVASGHIVVYNADTSEPAVSTINTAVGITRNNLVLVRPSANGKVSVTVHGGATDVLIDVEGWFAVERYAPSVSAMVSSPSSSAGYVAGEATTVTVTITNTDPTNTVSTALSYPFTRWLVPAVNATVGGAACAAPVVCSLSDTTLSVGPVSLAPGAQTTVTFPLVVSAQRGGCESMFAAGGGTIDVTATYSDNNAYKSVATLFSTAAYVCDNALGVEDWWSYDTRTVGPNTTASVNAANGNLVVQQVDGTPIQAHGRLGFTTRRTYNSQDRGVVSLGASVGTGWTLNVGDLAGGAPGVLGSGLYVPSAHSATAPLAVTLIDRDGTRHLFKPRAVSPLTLAASTGSPVGLAAKSPLLPPGYTHLCVDQTYRAPAGVYLSLWRYIAVVANGITNPCASLTTTPSTAVVAGFAAVRPDRFRTEYDALGQVTGMSDGAGNELRFEHFPGVIAGTRLRVTEISGRSALTRRTSTLAQMATVDASCGSVSRELDMTDPAGRVTRYCQVVDTTDGKYYLARVVNPDGSKVDYYYQSLPRADGTTAAGCGAPRGGLCAVTDAMTHKTSFTYIYALTGFLAVRPQVASITDRRGKVTNFDWHLDATSMYVNVNHPLGQRVRYSAIDSAGRVWQRDVGTAASTTDPSLISSVKQTVYTWDSTNYYCQVESGTPLPFFPDPRTPRENLLCSKRENTLGNNPAGSQGMKDSPDQLVDYLYNREGRLVRERRHTNPGVTGDALIDATTGYAATYVEADGSVRCYDDSVSAGGSVTSAEATCPDATGTTGESRLGSYVYVLSDMKETLTPNGNAAGTSWTQYRTSYTVDRRPGSSPNVLLADDSVICDEGAATGNSGLVCKVDAPHDGATRALTTYTYDDNGQRLTELRPQQQGTADSYEYAYYEDGTEDLSDTTDAGGWLKGVTDPDGNFVAFAYDAAGNVARSWDRNATTANRGTNQQRVPLADYPASGSSAYVEELREALPSKTSLSGPWRSVVNTRDQLGNISKSTVDDNGNVLSSTPPRGVAANSTAYTTSRTYGTGDELLTETRPQDAGAATADRTFHYDDLGRLDAEKDELGNATSHVYDIVGRHTRTWVVRGPAGDSALRSYTDGCSENTSWNPLLTWMPANSVVCHTKYVFYDGVDRVYFEYMPDGNLRYHTYDGAGRELSESVKRQYVTPDFTQYRYDADGHQTKTCGGEGIREVGWSECDSDNLYGTTSTYLTGGMMGSTTTKRRPSAGGAVKSLTTTFTYDLNRNLKTTTSPVAGRPKRTSLYDALDREICVETPRSQTAGDFNRVVTEYDPSGAMTMVSRPLAGACSVTTAPSSSRTTTYTYDAAHRLTDTVNAPTQNGAGTDGGTDVHTRVTYDADGHVIAQYDPRAFANGALVTDTPYVVRTTYDEAGRPEKVYVPRSGATGSAAPDPSITGMDGTAVTTQRDDCPMGAPSYPPTAYVCVTEYVHDLVGNVVTEWLPTSRGDRSPATSGTGARYRSFTYTPDRLLAVVSDPPAAGQTARVVSRMYYDGWGSRTAVMGARYNASDATAKYYDTEVTRYYGDRQVRVHETPAGVPATATTVASRTHLESYTYDGNGQVDTYVGLDGRTTTTTYFTDGLVEEVAAPSSRYGYFSASPGAPAGYNYDGADKTSYEYDDAGNVISVYSPTANAVGTGAADSTQSTRTPTRHEYTEDNLVKITRTPISSSGGSGAKYRQETYTYDAAGRRTSTKSETAVLQSDNSYSAGADATTISVSYYDNDRLKTETGRTNGTITRTYDAAGNVASADTSSSTTGDVANVTYYYDGLLRSADSNGRRATYAYDGLGREVARSLTTIAGVAAPGTTATKYDDGGRPTETTSPAAATGTGTDSLALGRLTRAYDAYGRLSTETAPNGAHSLFTWANDGTLTNREARRSTTDPTVLSKWSYTYDTSFRRLTQGFTGLDTGGTATVTSTYTYTPGGRVESFKDGSGSTKYATWDHNGNRTCFGVDCDHSTIQPTGSNRVKFTYRADNSIATETPSGSTTAAVYGETEEFGGVTSDRCADYTYDGFDRLMSTTFKTVSGCATGGTTYTYDALDRILSQTVGTTTTDFRYSGLSGGADRVSTATSSVDYAVDAAGSAFAVRDLTRTQHLVVNGARSTGTVLNTSSGVATVACQVRYDAFGNRIGTAGNGAASTCTATATPNDRYFEQARVDGTTGNYQFGTRTYDPGKAAFLTPDSYRTQGPAANVGLTVDPLTQNRYVYVNGDSVNFSDPTGHRRCTADERTDGCLDPGDEPIPWRPATVQDEFDLKLEDVVSYADLLSDVPDNVEKSLRNAANAMSTSKDPEVRRAAQEVLERLDKRTNSWTGSTGFKATKRTLAVLDFMFKYAQYAKSKGSVISVVAKASVDTAVDWGAATAGGMVAEGLCVWGGAATGGLVAAGCFAGGALILGIASEHYDWGEKVNDALARAWGSTGSGYAFYSKIEPDPDGWNGSAVERDMWAGQPAYYVCNSNGYWYTASGNWEKCGG